MISIRAAILVLMSIVATFVEAAPVDGAFPTPLPVDEQTNLTFAETYPGNWLFVHDVNMTSLIDGRMVLVDPDDPNHPIKAQVRAALFGSLIPVLSRREVLTSETFYSRLTRGERTDVLTIWDAATLQPKGEVVLPGGKRGLVAPQQAEIATTNGGNTALVWNFTPASSVTVVDLDARKVLSEVDTAGCSLVYPTGRIGFYSLCADGTLLSTQLDAAGNVLGRERSAAFNSIDDNALFLKRTTINGIDYFVSFLGSVQPIDIRGGFAKLLPAWKLVTDSETNAGWRPSGRALTANDASGRLYVLMKPDSREGSHKDGGTEVWVFDPVKGTRVQRIVLKQSAHGIEVGRAGNDRLYALSYTNEIDVYERDGRHVHTVGGICTGAWTVFGAR
jgi:methylamine dehydrogenase heavy chain